MLAFILFASIVLTRGYAAVKYERNTMRNDCGIAGTWKNELNSTVVFMACWNGQLIGKYNTAVGKASDYYVLTGRYTKSGPKNNVLELGWVVSWNNKKYGNSNSTTSWNGIYYPEEGVIYTQWILTSYVELKNRWTSSMINHDEFKRVCQIDNCH